MLPGAHFAAALVCLLWGAGSLVAFAPELAAGAFMAPRILATVHLFTLGWIALSIFGALCQFLPVAIGRGLRFPGLARVSLALHVLGTVTFVLALPAGSRPLLMLAGSALTGSFLLFALNLGFTLVGAKERTVTWWALVAATPFLLVTPAYGLVLAVNLHTGLLGAARFAFVARHAHVAIIGVVLLVAVGVAHRLLPMFLLSHGADERPARVALGLLTTSASLLAIPLPGSDGLTLLAGALALGGVAAFLVQAAAFLRHAKRRQLDPGMRLAAAGLMGVAAAALLAPVALARGLADPRLLATYYLVLLGGLSLFIAGHYYKIVPFLVWYHRFGPLVGTRKVPTVAELYSPKVARLNGVLLAGGWAGLVAATWMGSPVFARVAALIFAAGAALEALVLARVAQRRPA
jgi:hypothetical protein